MVLVGIFGAGGYAREVMPVARQTVSRKFSENCNLEIVFVVKQNIGGDNQLNGHRLITEEEFFSANAEEKYFNIAIADSRLRRKVADIAIKMNCIPLSLQAANCVIMDANQIGEGAILSPSVVITSNTKIGRFFHANLFSYVAHDCRIGDYVTFAPNVHCNGNVIVGNQAYIGTGAIIKQGSKEKPLVIGEESVIGMGAVVTKDVPPHTTVIGNPARPLIK